MTELLNDEHNEFQVNIELLNLSVFSLVFELLLVIIEVEGSHSHGIKTGSQKVASERPSAKYFY